MSEKDCEFISSIGIFKSCDVFSQNRRSSITNCSDINFNNLKANNTLYICISAVKYFFLNNFKNIKVPFILVTGDGDENPNDVFNDDNILFKYVNNPKLIHWYSQNNTTIHPKISAIPIGLDYHSMTNANTINKSWGDIILSLDLENLLKSFISKNKPFYERQIKCYANFQFLMNTRYRKTEGPDAMVSIPKELVFYEPNIIERKQTWENQSNYAFVISPFGNGYDCHRTYEALLLGCIPIIKKSPINIIYDNLPVLIINEWSDVTAQLLEDTVKEFCHKTFNYDKLKLKYWMDIINKNNKS